MTPETLMGRYEAGVRAFPGADLSGANLARAVLYQADLTNALLFEAKLAEAWLYDANLTGAVLCGADLTGAQLCGVQFVGANLAGATLDGAILDRTNFTGANLCNATMSSKIARRDAFDERTTWPSDPQFLAGATMDGLPLAAAVEALGTTFSGDQFATWAAMHRVAAARDASAPQLEVNAMDRS